MTPNRNPRRFGLLRVCQSYILCLDPRAPAAGHQWMSERRAECSMYWKERSQLTAFALRGRGLLRPGVFGLGLLDQLLLVRPLPFRSRLSLLRRQRSLVGDAVENAQAEGRVAENLDNVR